MVRHRDAKPGNARRLEQGSYPKAWLAEYEKPGSSRQQRAIVGNSVAPGCARKVPNLPKSHIASPHSSEGKNPLDFVLI
jgi:hypothetical protein